jgi:hypothetical protein
MYPSHQLLEKVYGHSIQQFDTLCVSVIIRTVLQILETCITLCFSLGGELKEVTNF